MNKWPSQNMPSHKNFIQLKIANIERIKLLEEQKFKEKQLNSSHVENKTSTSKTSEKLIS